ncbi:MAG: alpha/beta fold hydrolase [Bryobacteraceae bacterium]|jgi:pimeloyl-ACP methyl ester carboxylesterase
MMQRKLALAILFSLAVTLLAADISGPWRGTLEPGMMRLRLGLNVTRADSGTLAATLDSYDQGALGIPVDSIGLDGNRVTFTIAGPGISYQGTLSAGGNEIDGKFTQGGMSFPLKLTRGAGSDNAVKRPQQPKPPYPYKEEEVTVDNTKGAVRLGGTLTLPAGTGPFPAVVLLSGSGPHDRDETLFGHKPFLVIADSLTRRGTAVLRFDDRGVGKSSGIKMASTEDDLAGDAMACVEYLRSRKDILPRSVGLIGHSEGGILAPLAAAGSPDVAFIVMLAGPAIPGEELLKLQARALMHAAGASDEHIQAENDVQDRLFALIRGGGDPKAMEQKLHAALREYLAKLPEEQRKALGDAQAFEDSQVKTIMTADLRSIILSDPAKTLRKVRCPVLGLNGGLDLQVPADANLPALAGALAAAGNPDYAIVKLPGLNHLFQTARTGLVGEYGAIEETFSPTALDIIGAWIARHVK